MDIKQQIKEIVIKELNLVDVTVDDIDDDDALFGPKFGLDSIDAIELVFQVKKAFGVEIKDMNEGRPALESVNTLSAFIRDRQTS